MNKHVSSLSGRLSLRAPQRLSLETLHRVMELTKLTKASNTADVLAQIQSEFKNVESFERAFPSLCFSLATGVGKTRLMGAFVAYLHLQHGVRNFFILAPNLTIYTKLRTDFTPNTPKYVFEGVSEFAVTPPKLTTGENFDRHSNLDLLNDEITVNVFNIAKFNAKNAESRKVRSFQEVLGQSYFDYLASLDDLVLIMDEAHRYRADTSMKSIEDLKPVLGLELTATPHVEVGTKSTRFKNIIYDYPLSNAMKDGFVKEPAVGTRKDFNADAMDKPALERLKLEDGIRLHESTKVELDVYARNSGEKRVKPFVLVIAEDTEHANKIVEIIQSPAFFGGQYKDKVIQVHSGQRGAEKDENVERLLAVESADEATEIVVHVNMLKEGWDVTNLYTIVPLRAANAKTLVEQSIGRGLRLPFGKRTGVQAVDRLTIVAHDKFQDIVDEAKKGGYIFSEVNLDASANHLAKHTIVVPSVLHTILGIPVSAAIGAGGAVPVVMSSNDETMFKTPETLVAAQHTLAAIKKVVNESKGGNFDSLTSKETQQKLVQDVQRKLNVGQYSLFGADPLLAPLVKDVTAQFVAHSILIPRVLVVPVGVERTGFSDFELDLSSFRQQPVSQEILIVHLQSNKRETHGAAHISPTEERLEDYVIRGMIDFDDIDYETTADFLYRLAGQFVAHLKSYLADESVVENVLQYYQHQIVQLIHSQMMCHSWAQAEAYEAVVHQGYLEMQPEYFGAESDDAINFDIPLEQRKDIPFLLFNGFQKCLYPVQKFGSDPERRLAVLFERDSDVKKWFKPGRGTFKITYSSAANYEPDFVVETENEYLICEPKRSDQMQDPVVVAKKRAAMTWCEHASKHAKEQNAKPWKYLLISHETIGDNISVAHLIRTYG
jgi:type III restriction enzyme